MGSLALRPALLLFGNSRPQIAPAPLPRATGAYGQLPGRDFNPLDERSSPRTVIFNCGATGPNNGEEKRVQVLGVGKFLRLRRRPGGGGRGGGGKAEKPSPPRVPDFSFFLSPPHWPDRPIVFFPLFWGSLLFFGGRRRPLAPRVYLKRFR